MAQWITIAVNQTQLANRLWIDAPRLAWATDQGIVHRIEGTKNYDLDSAIGEWLEYERRKRKTSKRRSTLEREKAALTKARRQFRRAQRIEGRIAIANRRIPTLKRADASTATQLVKHFETSLFLVLGPGKLAQFEVFRYCLIR